MTLVDSGRAMGAVTKLLQARLMNVPGMTVADVTVGRPEPPSGNGGPTNPRVNLFLFEVRFDPYLMNVPLDEGQVEPVWASLHYLLTAFDQAGESDSADAHELLGQGIRALRDLNYLSLANLPATVVAALADSPDPLKITFLDASADLLSKLMQGSDEKIRCSVAFEVRPVMIAGGEPPEYQLLVGIDYEAGTIIGDDGVRTPVLASLGPSLTSVSPGTFDAADIVTVEGADLDLPNVRLWLDAVELDVTSQRATKLTCRLPATIVAQGAISAGSHLLTATQTLPTGRLRRSNGLVAALRPRLDTAVESNVQRVVPANPQSPVTATIDVNGAVLGTTADDVFLALYRDGAVVRLLDAFTVAPAPEPPQSHLVFQIPNAAAVPQGSYRVVLRVNGAQAKNSPVVDLVAP